MVLWRPIRPSRMNTKTSCPSHYRGLECKSRKSRDTWSNKQVWPWSTKWSRAKASRVLPREHTGHSQQPLSTTEEMTLHMDITRWLIPKSDWLYSLQSKLENLYRVSKNKTRSWLWNRPWTLCCQIQTKIEVRKITRAFSFDLNQIPYNYTVEVKNRFKGLDLIDRVPEKLWMEVCDIVQKAVIRPSPRKTNAKRQNGCLRKPYKQLRKEEKLKAEEKRKDIPIWMQSSKE